jgi:hypothetical protein
MNDIFITLGFLKYNLVPYLKFQNVIIKTILISYSSLISFKRHNNWEQFLKTNKKVREKKISAIMLFGVFQKYIQKFKKHLFSLFQLGVFQLGSDDYNEKKMNFYMPKFEVSAENEGFKNSLSDHPKSFFFWVNNLRYANDFYQLL